jgi:hypothetical protein
VSIQKWTLIPFMNDDEVKPPGLTSRRFFYVNFMARLCVEIGSMLR